MPLTDRSIRAAKTGLHADMGGLYLKVYPTGRKTFIVRTRTAGKDSVSTIGEYPAMGLAAARQRLLDSRSLTTNYTVNTAFDLYYDHLQTQYRRPELVLRVLLKDVLPVIGSKPLISLARADCTEVLQRIIARGSPVQANRTLAVMCKALAFCEQRGWIPTNPLAGVRRASIGGKESAKSRNLNWDEISALYALLASHENGLSAGSRWALRVIILTGLRATEALTLQDNGTVFTKSGRTHRVPLTPHVRALLKCRPTLPKDHRVLSHALRRLGQTFTPHDLRRTFASRMSDLGVMPHVIEKMLDHQMEGVMAVYNRAEFWPERVAAQRLWGFKLAELRRKKTPD